MKQALIAIFLVGAFFIGEKASATIIDSNTTPLGTGNCPPGFDVQCAEYFVPTQTSYIEQINLYLSTSASSTQNVILKIYQAKTNREPQTLLWTTTISTDSITGSYSWIPFVTGITLGGGVGYDLVISAPNSQLSWGGGATSSTVNQNFLLSLDSGNTWIAGATSGDLNLNFITYDNTDELSFTEPIDNSYVTNPIDFRGTCNSENPFVSIQFNEENGFLDYQDFSIQSIACSATSSWHFDDLFLTPVRWNARLQQASSTVQIGINVYEPDFTETDFEGSNSQQCRIANWTCEIPFLSWNLCEDLAYMTNNVSCYAYNTIKLNGLDIQNKKPYSYVTDFRTAFETGNLSHTSTIGIITATATATSTTPSIVFTIFDPSMFEDIISAEQWASLQGLFRTVLYVVFGLYLYRRILQTA